MIDASQVQEHERNRLDTVAGLMSAASIFLGVLGVTDFNLSISGHHFEMRPIRIGIASVLLALIAAGIGGRHSRLATVAVTISAVCWFLGMVIAVLTERPLF